MDPFTIALVLMVASYTITALTTKTVKREPGSLEDFDFPQIEEGTPHAIFFGDCWTAGWLVIWYGNMRTTKIKGGGKK